MDPQNISYLSHQNCPTSEKVKISQLCPSEFQPRTYFDETAMAELTKSVKQHGVLHPIIVRPIGESRYELVAGERRYKAAKAAGLSEVPVVIQTLSDLEVVQYALMENLQREDLNPVEETEGILQLLELKLETDRPSVISLLNQMANTLLRDAVGLRMMADVPLGAFLSGGVDSSTLVALMQAQSTQPVKTFTIGTYDQIYNEAEQAQAIAQHLGTDHTELYVTAEDALAVIPKLPILYDEPFSDSSQIPTFLISQLTRQQVTVSLSGDGGDELFAGYNRHLWGRSFWQKFGRIPPRVRQMAAGAITQFSPKTWDAIFQKGDGLIPKRFKLRQPGDKLQKLAEILAIPNPQSLYPRLVSDCINPESIVYQSLEPERVLNDSNIWMELSDLNECLMYLDTVTYLPDDILAKVDRASMGVSLEARVPYLDHRVVEFAWQIPLSLKIRNGMGKWLLRQVLHQYVPAPLIEGPKMGFAVPIDQWLRGELRDWAEALLDEERLCREGFFNPEPIRQKWEEHLSGRHDWKYYLWDILMYQLWLESNH